MTTLKFLSMNFRPTIPRFMIGVCSFVVLCLFSCNQSESDELLDFEVRLVETDFGQLRNLQDSFDPSFRWNFETRADTVKVFGVLKDGTPFVYNNHQPQIRYVNSTLKYSRYSFVSICNGDILFFSEENNAVVLVDEVSEAHEIVYEDIIGDGEHPIGPLYSQRAFRCFGDGNIAFQIGERNGSVNLLGDYLFKVFSGDSVFYFLDTPEELHTDYIHYNDASVVFSDDFVYVIFPTSGTLYTYGISGELINRESIPGNYLEFDRERGSDPLYIHDYTYETTYNLRLFDMGADKLGLVQRMAVDQYYVHLFSKSQSEYIGRYKLPFNPYYYYIDSEPDTMIFGLPHLNEVHRITAGHDF